MACQITFFVVFMVRIKRIHFKFKLSSANDKLCSFTKVRNGWKVKIVIPLIFRRYASPNYTLRYSVFVSLIPCARNVNFHWRVRRSLLSCKSLRFTRGKNILEKYHISMEFVLMVAGFISVYVCWFLYNSYLRWRI